MGVFLKSDLFRFVETGKTNDELEISQKRNSFELIIKMNEPFCVSNKNNDNVMQQELLSIKDNIPHPG